MKKGDLTKEHILKEARKILVRNGFHNTSISDIIEATGVKKGNLYYHFASKEDLGLAVLQDAEKEFCTLLDNSFSGDTPRKKIIHSVEVIFSEIKRAGLTGGCLFGNTALEMSDSHPRFSGVIHTVFEYWLDKLEEQLVQDQVNQAGNDQTHPRPFAKLIVSAIEGAIMMSRVSKDEKDLDDCLLALKDIMGE